MKIEKGQKAPAFNLFNTEKNEIKLDSFKGQNVVLLFFPLAFTSTCTKELCSVRDTLAEYNQLNTVVLGISVDSVFSLAKYKAEQSLNFDLLSDFNKETSTAYGCLYNDFILGMKGVSKRAAFVIDKEGFLRHSEVLENAGEIPNFEAIQSVLKTLNA